MPNYCENDLTIMGAGALAALESVCSLNKEGEKYLDFNKIIPYPKQYRDMDDRSVEFQEKRAAVCAKYERDSVSGDYPQACEDELSKISLFYGVEPGTPWLTNGYNAGGYEWCCANWGTKWNAKSCEFAEASDNQASVSFDTAWLPPVLVIEKLVEMFPNLEFLLEFYESGMEFSGSMRFKDRKLDGGTFDDNYRGNRGG